MNAKLENVKISVLDFDVGKIEDAILSYKLVVENLDRIGVVEDVMPRALLKEWFFLRKKNIKTIVLKGNSGVIGTAFCLAGKSVLYCWLGGFMDRTHVNFSTSALTYHYLLKYAITNGFKIIETGRSPYQPKKQHGMVVSPIWAGVIATHPKNHMAAGEWMSELAKMHVEQYNLRSVI